MKLRVEQKFDVTVSDVRPFPATDIVGESATVVGYLPGRQIEDLTLRIRPRVRLRSGTIIYAGSTIGSDSVTDRNVVIREQNALGDHAQTWNNTTVDYGCRIGDHVKIHTNCYIAQFTTLKDEVFLAPDDLTCRTEVATEGHSYHPYTHRRQGPNPVWLCSSR